MRTIAIETSCDETAVAVLDGDGRIVSSLLASQAQTHSRYGGVVPEVASREHLRALDGLIEAALEESGEKDALDLVSVTSGPGLIGALLVGVRYASAFAWGLGLPLVAVDHLEGHMLSPFLDLEGAPARALPSCTLALVASGGHSGWYRVTPENRPERLCRTRDDAAGESFDKVAKVLGLPYPGGPVIDRLARRGDQSAVTLPRPRIKDNPLDFSFSGLKSAAIRESRRRALETTSEAASSQGICDLLASFELAVIDVLLDPLPELYQLHQPDVITASGGVAANSLLRRRLVEAGKTLGVEVLLPPLELTTDNAAMIARAGQLAWARGESQDPRRFDARSSEKWQPPGMRSNCRDTARRLG